MPRAILNNAMSQSYGVKLDFSFFDTDMCQRLDQLAHAVIAGYDLPGYEFTDHTKIRFYNDAILHIPELAALRDKCKATIVGVPIMGFVPPYSVMGVHRDGYGCSCKLMLPIWPETPTSLMFYEDEMAPAVFALDTIRFQPVLFNGDALHGGIDTGNAWRTNIQIMFGEPYDQILEMIRGGNLFNDFTCSVI